MGWVFDGERENGDGECLKLKLVLEKETEICVVMEALGTFCRYSRRRDSPVGGGRERGKNRDKEEETLRERRGFCVICVCVF